MSLISHKLISRGWAGTFSLALLGFVVLWLAGCVSHYEAPDTTPTYEGDKDTQTAPELNTNRDLTYRITLNANGASVMHYEATFQSIAERYGVKLTDAEMLSGGGRIFRVTFNLPVSVDAHEFLNQLNSAPETSRVIFIVGKRR